MSNVISPRLLHVDPAELQRRVSTQPIDLETAKDLVDQAGRIGTLSKAQLDVFTTAAAAPGASAIARDIMQAFLDGRPSEPRSALSFLQWKPAPAAWAKGAADVAVKGADRRSENAVRDFLSTVDPILARTSMSQLLGKRTVSMAMMQLEQAPANGVATSELVKTLLQDIQPPPPFKDLMAQVGKRPVDTGFALQLLSSAALSSSPKEAFAALGGLATSTAPMSESGRAFLQGVNDGLADGKSDVGALHDRAMYGQHGGGVREARDALRAFDRALGELDPKLAQLGHTQLIMGGHPKIGDAFRAIANAATGPEGENLGAFAKQTIQTALN